MFLGERKKNALPTFFAFTKTTFVLYLQWGRGGGRLRKLPHTAHFDYLFVYPIRVVSWVLSFFLPVFCYFNNRSHNLFRVFSSNVKFGCRARKSRYLKRVNSFADNVGVVGLLAQIYWIESDSLLKYVYCIELDFLHKYTALSWTPCTNIMHWVRLLAQIYCIE